KNVQRAADFYSRTAGRYARNRPHGIREPVLARQRDAIVELARPRSTDSVLDVGCGAGRVAAVLRPRVAWICGADASSEMLALARRAQGVRVRLYTSRRLRALAAGCGLRCTAARRLPGGSVAVMLEHAEPGV